MQLRLRRMLAAAMTALAAVASAAQAQTQASSGAEAAGDGNQPQWTVHSLFAESDVYVLPKGTSAFVFGLRPTTATNGAVTTDTAYRAEFGLPARFQVGLHAAGRTEGRDDVIGNIDAQAIEVRWAIAKWGTVWGNPTIHVEWREASRGADAGTMKLLLGDGRANGWRWGSNVAWTQEASGTKATERAFTAGVSRAAGTLASVGAEARLAFVDRLEPGGGTRSVTTRELLAGPSVQIRPVAPLHIDLAALFGTDAASPRSRLALVAGWQF